MIQIKKLSPLKTWLIAAGAFVFVVLVGFLGYFFARQLKIEFISNAEVGVNETADN